MKFYTPFTLPKDWNEQSALLCEDVSLATQSERDECDINTIVKRFGITGHLPYGVQVPVYDDYTMIPNDYHAALQYLEDSQAAFMEMPALVRSRFDNDAGLFLDFVNAPSNYDEAISLGLVPPKPSGLAEPDDSSGSVKPEGRQGEAASGAQSST